MPNLKAIQPFHSGKRLQKLREFQGLSALELASELDIEFSTLVEWEKKGIPKEFIKKCIYYFEVSPLLFTTSVSSQFDLDELVRKYLFPQNEELLRYRLTLNEKNKDELLDLSDLFLSEIPSKIIDFQWVRELNLSNNQLKKIPSFIALLKNINKIDISNNLLNQIPAIFLTIDTLESLNFENNPLFLQKNLLTSSMSLDEYKKSIFNEMLSIVVVKKLSTESLYLIDILRDTIEKKQPLLIKENACSQLEADISSVVYITNDMDVQGLLEEITYILPKKPCPIILLTDKRPYVDHLNIYSELSSKFPKYYSLFKVIDDESKIPAIFSEIQKRITYQERLPSVKLDTLSLRNIGVYESLDVTFDQNLTVLIGLNGAGKTTVLKALALAILGPIHAEMDSHSSADLLRITGQENKKTYWELEGEICLRVNIDGVSYNNTINLKYNLNSEKIVIEGSHFEELFDEDGYLINLILGIGEQRNTSLKKPRNSGLEILQPKPRDLLPIISEREQACIAHFTSWLGNLALAASQGENEKQQEINISFAIFSALMKESVQFAGLTKIDPLELWIKHQNPQQIVPLRLASQGYQAVMGWIGYIIQRMFEAYSDALQALQQPAIIMIDEIDQLLHVKWQQKILNVLAKEFFPNTQWIITTHSPMVVAGLDQKQVVQLHQSNGQLVAEPNAVDLWAWQYGDIVRYLFEIAPEKPHQQESQLIKDMEEIQALPNTEQTVQQKERLEKLTIRLERVRKSRAFIDELYAEQQKLREREQELATLIEQLNKSSKA